MESLLQLRRHSLKGQAPTEWPGLQEEPRALLPSVLVSHMQRGSPRSAPVRQSPGTHSAPSSPPRSWARQHHCGDAPVFTDMAAASGTPTPRGSQLHRAPGSFLSAICAAGPALVPAASGWFPSPSESLGQHDFLPPWPPTATQNHLVMPTAPAAPPCGRCPVPGLHCYSLPRVNHSPLVARTPEAPHHLLRTSEPALHCPQPHREGLPASTSQLSSIAGIPQTGGSFSASPGSSQPPAQPQVQQGLRGSVAGSLSLPTGHTGQEAMKMMSPSGEALCPGRYLG